MAADLNDKEREQVVKGAVRVYMQKNGIDPTARYYVTPAGRVEVGVTRMLERKGLSVEYVED